MTDFSFYNKAYDLLLKLKDEEVIKPIKNKPNTMGELRLLIDMAKNAYPLYSIAEPKTISEIVNDLFKIETTKQDIILANYEKEYYRPVKIQDIEPGVHLKIVEDTHEYYHTFWTYEDTGKIIPVENTTLLHYNQAFMYIWEKAKKGKVFIKNIFEHRTGDIVVHRNDPNSYGTIKGRMFFNPNQYSVIWQNTGNNKDVPLTHWFNENHLINKTKLEAMPMKTNEIIQQTKQNKIIATIRYKEFNPQEWLDENIIAGRDKEVYEKLLISNTNRKEFGWIEKERRLIIGRYENVQKTILNWYKFNNKDLYKDVEIISTDPIPTKKINIKLQQNTKKKTKHQLNSINHTNKLVCVQHTNTGVIARIEQNLAKEVVTSKGNYVYVSKHEYRKYRTIVSTNKKASGLTEPKKEKPEPKLSTMGTTLVPNPKTGEFESIPMDRKGRRYDKHKRRKSSRLVKEQFITKIIPEEKVSIVSINPTLNEYTESGFVLRKIPFESTFIKPAHTLIKRILTRIRPHKEIKITEDIRLQKLERSATDKQLYLQKKDFKSLPELVEEFEPIDRRNDRFSTVEKWSLSFDKIYTIIISGISEISKGVSTQLKKKAQRIIIDDIIKENHSFKWDDNKISNFIRYLRLTTHGIFGEKTKFKRPVSHKKLSRIKKPIQSVEFEVIKTATRIDYSKLKQNLPEVNKVIYIKFNDAGGEIEKVGIYKEGDMYSATGEFLCAMRDVIAWKYKKDKEYQDVIIDEGGGITQVPVKFRRKDPEHLKVYFARQKAKKLKTK